MANSTRQAGATTPAACTCTHLQAIQPGLAHRVGHALCDLTACVVKGWATGLSDPCIYVSAVQVGHAGAWSLTSWHDVVCHSTVLPASTCLLTAQLHLAFPWAHRAAEQQCQGVGCCCRASNLCRTHAPQLVTMHQREGRSVPLVVMDTCTRMVGRCPPLSHAHAPCLSIRSGCCLPWDSQKYGGLWLHEEVCTTKTLHAWR